MMTALLFANVSDFLGEVRFHDGAFLDVMLTHRGEGLIGPAVKDWQTRGVPVRREVFGSRQHPRDVVFYQERIQPRDRGFADALRQWCSDHRLTAVLMQAHAQVECWNLILRLPLEPSERFAFLAALVQADADELIAWRTFLVETVRIVVSEEHKTDEAIIALQEKAAAGLKKRFSRSVHA